MARRVSLSLRGDKELVAKIRQMTEELRGEALKDAVEIAGEVIVDEATLKVPVKTGNLKASIFVEPAKVKGTTASVRVGPSKNAPYGKFVEYGTNRTRAQPFMRPAADTRKADVASAVRETLQRIVDEAAS